MKNSIFLLGIGILISIFRFVIDSIDSIDLILTMAVINVIAFNYVVVLIQIDIRKIVEENLKKSNLPDEQQKACIKNEKKIMGIFSWLVFVVLSIIYVIILRTSAFNDILSIMALMLSISQNQISEYLGEKIYNRI